jgi:hypothetical protein
LYNHSLGRCEDKTHAGKSKCSLPRYSLFYFSQDAKGVQYHSMKDTFYRIYTEEGWQTLFSGVKPRTTWISIGGFVFFGVYEKASAALSVII